MTKALKLTHALLLRLARALGRLNTLILLTLSFFAILWPVSAAHRLRHRSRHPKGWLRRDPLPGNHYRKQY